MHDARPLARAVQALPGSRRRRFPRELRARLIAYVRARHAEHVAMRTIAEELGISYESVRRWAHAAPSPIRAVEIAPAVVSATTPVLVAPSGHRVEGLGRDDLIAVLRALG